MQTHKQLTLKSTNYLSPNTYLYRFKQQFLNYGVAHLATTTLLAPLERWRIIAQTQRAYPLRPKKFAGFLDYLRRVPGEQGITAFWRSNTACLWIYLYQKLFQIGVYDSIKQLNKQFNQQAFDSEGPNYITDNIVFPLYASIISLAVIQPLDNYRIQKAMSYHKNSSEALFTKFRHRLSQVGSVRNMYQGFWLANLIAVININFYKNMSELIGKVEIDGVSTDVVNKELVLSVLGVALVHPIDTFKKIYQLNNMHKPAIFSNYRSVAKYLSQNKLNSALFNGFVVSVTRTALFIPIYWQIAKLWRQVYINPNQDKIV